MIDKRNDELPIELKIYALEKSVNDDFMVDYIEKKNLNPLVIDPDNPESLKWHDLKDGNGGKSLSITDEELNFLQTTTLDNLDERAFSLQGNLLTITRKPDKKKLILSGRSSAVDELRGQHLIDGLLSQKKVNPNQSLLDAINHLFDTPTHNATFKMVIHTLATQTAMENGYTVCDGNNDGKSIHIPQKNAITLFLFSQYRTILSGKAAIEKEIATLKEQKNQRDKLDDQLRKELHGLSLEKLKKEEENLKKQLSVKQLSVARYKNRILQKQCDILLSEQRLALTQSYAQNAQAKTSADKKKIQRTIKAIKELTSILSAAEATTSVIPEELESGTTPSLFIDYPGVKEREALKSLKALKTKKEQLEALKKANEEQKACAAKVKRIMRHHELEGLFADLRKQEKQSQSTKDLSDEIPIELKIGTLETLNGDMVKYQQDRYLLINIENRFWPFRLKEQGYNQITDDELELLKTKVTETVKFAYDESNKDYVTLTRSTDGKAIQLPKRKSNGQPLEFIQEIKDALMKQITNESSGKPLFQIINESINESKDYYSEAIHLTAEKVAIDQSGKGDETIRTTVTNFLTSQKAIIGNPDAVGAEIQELKQEKQKIMHETQQLAREVKHSTKKWQQETKRTGANVKKSSDKLASLRQQYDILLARQKSNQTASQAKPLQNQRHARRSAKAVTRLQHILSAGRTFTAETASAGTTSATPEKRKNLKLIEDQKAQLKEEIESRQKQVDTLKRAEMQQKIRLKRFKRLKKYYASKGLSVDFDEQEKQSQSRFSLFAPKQNQQEPLTLTDEANSPAINHR